MVFGIFISILAHFFLLVFILNQGLHNKLVSKHESLFFLSYRIPTDNPSPKNRQNHRQKVAKRNLPALESKIAPTQAVYPSTNSSQKDFSHSPPFIEYAMALRSQISEKLKYPYSVRKRKLAGRVIIQLIWNPFENAPLIEVKASSGHDSLDRLALEAVQGGLKEIPFDRDRLFGNPIARKSKLECNQTIEFKLADTPS